MQLQAVQSWTAFMAQVADLDMPAGLALPDFAYPLSATVADQSDEDITVNEVEAQLQDLHNGSAPGHLGLPAELLRHAKGLPRPGQAPPAHSLAPALAALLTAMFRAGSVPPSLNHALVTPVYKKGDSQDTANYRPIAITEAIMRLYARLLNKRLISFTEGLGLRAASQAGFRPAMSILHQVFSLQHLVIARGMRGAICTSACGT